MKYEKIDCCDNTLCQRYAACLRGVIMDSKRQTGVAYGVLRGEGGPECRQFIDFWNQAEVEG